MSRLRGMLGQLPPSTLILLAVLGFVVLAIPIMNWLNTSQTDMEEVTLVTRPPTPKPLEALPLPLLVTTDPPAQTETLPIGLPSTTTEVGAKPALPNPFVALPGQNSTATPTPKPVSTPKPPSTPTTAPQSSPTPRPTPAPAPTPVSVTKPKPAVKVSALQQFVTNNDLRLTGVTVGSVRVGILSSRWGGMVLAQGDFVPGSSVKVGRVESNKVILVQGKETAVLRLGEGE